MRVFMSGVVSAVAPAVSFHAVNTIYVWLFTGRLPEVLHANAPALEALAGRSGSDTLRKTTNLQAHPIFLLPQSDHTPKDASCVYMLLF